MNAAPEMRKPASGKTGSLEISKSFAAIDTREINLNERQAQRLLERFSMSWPMARAIAELAFHSGGAA